jgi:hypothetical protein
MRLWDLSLTTDPTSRNKTRWTVRHYAPIRWVWVLSEVLSPRVHHFGLVSGAEPLISSSSVWASSCFNSLDVLIG